MARPRSQELGAAKPKQGSEELRPRQGQGGPRRTDACSFPARGIRARHLGILFRAQRIRIAAGKSSVGNDRQGSKEGTKHLAIEISPSASAPSTEKGHNDADLLRLYGIRHSCSAARRTRRTKSRPLPKSVRRRTTSSEIVCPRRDCSLATNVVAFRARSSGRAWARSTCSSSR
jgi:hypothetical protein